MPTKEIGLILDRLDSDIDTAEKHCAAIERQIQHCFERKARMTAHLKQLKERRAAYIAEHGQDTR